MAEQPGPRRRGWGGSVILRPDPHTFTLDHLSAADKKVTAPSGKPAKIPGGQPRSGADRLVPIPEGTKVYNAEKRDCDHACRGRGPACRRACSEEPGVEILPDGGQYLVAAGGRCGGGKGERHVINLTVRPFETAKQANAYVRSLGFPYVMVEDASQTTQMVKFIIQAPAKAAKRLIDRQNRSSPYNISARYEVFRVRWGDLSRRGDRLVIERTRRGFKRAYEVAETETEGEGPPRLRPVRLGAKLRLDSSRVVKADITQLLRLPSDAYLLEVGVRPSDMWFEPFLPGAPVFGLLLLLFIVLNGLAIAAYFKR